MTLHKTLYSMTGFSTVDAEVLGKTYRIEIKSLNHRFLEIKFRLPRELSSIELPFRAACQEVISRGSLEIKAERLPGKTVSGADIPFNSELAEAYFEILSKLQKNCGLKNSIQMSDVLTLPDLFSKPEGEVDASRLWAELSPYAKEALDRLLEMRKGEGDNLRHSLLPFLSELENSMVLIRSKRTQFEQEKRQKITEKVKTLFDLFPLAGLSTQAVLETRVAQELSLLLERSDIEEELTRFEGHLQHLRAVLEAGGLVGRKWDFILQELSREINTLGNKAQALTIGEEVVRIKVKLEQLREQGMNLE